MYIFLQIIINIFIYFISSQNLFIPETKQMLSLIVEVKGEMPHIDSCV